MTLEGVGVERPMLERVAWRTALLFAIVGVLWILFSDKLVAFFVTDPHEITRVQIFKGWFFVTVTSVFLYFMLRAQFRLWDREFMRANQAVRALRASEVRLRTLAEQASDGIFLCESTGRCVDANAAGCQMIGYAPDEVRGLSIPDVVAPQESEQIEPQLKRLMAGQPIKTHWHLRRKDGSIFHGEINARRLPDGRILGVVRDVTERLRLEENLRQSQKMEAVGQLAGGVAHDFNNLLTVIMGSCDLAISSLPDDHAAVRFLREVQAGGERAAALTRQLLTFSRRSSHEPRVIDLNRAVRDTEPLLRRLVGNHGTLELDLDPSALHVRADP
ncbi:MAG TPA: PAS domain S-box protein, partial [Phycisphaerales bacterium]|nr:PAS domain S-box protein [Phycisphaerales bacterium]